MTGSTTIARTWLRKASVISVSELNSAAASCLPPLASVGPAMVPCCCCSTSSKQAVRLLMPPKEAR